VENDKENVEFNLHEAAEELIASDSGAATGSTQGSASEGQLETDPAKTEATQLSAEDVLNGKVGEVTPPVVDAALLESVNKLGAIHNGMPIKVDTPEQLKEILQKGFDYTKKTMTLAEEGKVKQEEWAEKENSFKERDATYAQKEQGLQEVSFQNNIVNSMVDKWKTSDPELYNYIQAQFQSEIAEFQKSQPIIAQYENRFKQLDEKLSQFEQGKQQETLGSIKQSWEKELGELQTARAPRLKELGIVPNWDKVKEVYAADASNTMTAEKALLAVHGADMIKMAESQIKALQAKSKVQGHKLGRGGVGYSQKASATVDVKGGDIMSYLRAESNNLN
jgi:hypothetical protein